jgi:hypothetical protein
LPGGNQVMNCCCYRRQASDRSHRQQAHLPQCPDAAGQQACSSATPSSQQHPREATLTLPRAATCYCFDACHIMPAQLALRAAPSSAMSASLSVQSALLKAALAHTSLTTAAPALLGALATGFTCTEPHSYPSSRHALAARGRFGLQP